MIIARQHTEILLVGSDSKALDSLVNYFKFVSSFELQLFSNPINALAYIEAHPVEVLITDTNMPEMSGIDLLQEALRFKPQFKVIVLFEGLMGSTITPEEIKRLGAWMVLTKSELFKILQSYLGNT